MKVKNSIYFIVEKDSNGCHVNYITIERPKSLEIFQQCYSLDMDMFFKSLKDKNFLNERHIPYTEES